MPYSNSGKEKGFPAGKFLMLLERMLELLLLDPCSKFSPKDAGGALGEEG